jgi:hypothetical protein
MKKLNLDVSALRVESFETAAHGREDGTVHAHSVVTAGPETCVQHLTCFHSAYCDATGVLSHCGCATVQCTGNEGDLGCYNSLHFCLETQVSCDICVSRDYC